MSTPPPAASTKSTPTSSRSSPVPAATASAVRSATSAVASLSRRLALEDRGDAPGQADPPADGGRRHGVGWCDHGADRERQRPGEVGQQQLGDDRDTGRGEDDQPDGQQQDRPAVGAEVDERRALRGGVQQRRQEPEEHDLLGEVDLRHLWDVRRRDADHDEQERRGDVEPVGHRRAYQDHDGHAAEQQGDLHARILAVAATQGVSARIRSSRARRSRPADDGLDDLDAAVGVGQRVLELGEVVDPPVRRAGRRAERREVDAVRGAEEPLERVRVLGCALLEHREDRAAVVVDDHDRQVRARLVGPEHQPVAVVQERHVAHQREVARCRAAGRAPHRSPSTPCRRCRTGRGWRSPCAGSPTA